MAELLAPAGDFNALKAAIANGADAVYLGMKDFGARAYSDNFDEEKLKEAVGYAHLRDVKVYVTVNTIVFEDELDAVKERLYFLNSIGVDGVIVQDLAVLRFAKETFLDMEAHCSTQMGIDDLEGALLCKKLGADRIVLAREADIEKVKRIKKEAGIPVEIFVHGALCVSYSGNCLMSGLIGYRSGNRGRCVGSCRKPYELLENGKSLGLSYILSTKDLCTIENIEELKDIDSLKIEGRMKEPVYVANVVRKYREALDGKKVDKADLEKTFNRTYTSGYLFGEDKKDITNIDRPNNYGQRIGFISAFQNGMYEITLIEPLYQNDIIRIDHAGEDVNLSVVKLYDREGLLVNGADKKAYIKIKESLSKGDIVFKTKDYAYYKELEGMLDGDYKKQKLDIDVYAYPGAKLILSSGDVTVESEETLEEAKTNPTSKEQGVEKLAKLGDSVFTLGEVNFEENNAFIPAKMINNLRRALVEELYKEKLLKKERRTKEAEKKEVISFDKRPSYLTCQVRTKAQYDAAKEAGIAPENIYFENIVPRNQNNYEDREGLLVIGGLGGIEKYRDKNEYITDYSLNVVNADSVYELHKLGAKRVTLSYEMNKKQIRDVLDSYKGHPSLEMIVYGKAPLMVTRYCPLKKYGLCGKCEKNTYTIRDEYGEFKILPKIDPKRSDCLITICNGKCLNLLDEMAQFEGIEAFRLNFTDESQADVKKVIKTAQGKLDGSLKPSVFNQETDTRGHFNKEIM